MAARGRLRERINDGTKGQMFAEASEPLAFKHQRPANSAAGLRLTNLWLWFVQEIICSGGRTRTADPVVNSHLLYRLSYAGTIQKAGT